MRPVLLPAGISFAALLASSVIAGGCARQASKPTDPAGSPAPAEPAEMSAVPPSPPAPPSPDTAPQSLVVDAFPGIRVHPDRHRVEITAWVCLDAGWLEQVACTPGTREHESLVVVTCRPSNIHAALLLAGLEPGSPGRWTYEHERTGTVPPRGDAVDVLVRYPAGDAGEVTVPIHAWIADHRGQAEFPDDPWIFGGSELRPNPPGMDPGEHYAADMTGSVIGLVTFGDEVVGFSEVIADQADVQAPQWVVNSEKIPPIGSEVTLIVQRAANRP